MEVMWQSVSGEGRPVTTVNEDIRGLPYMETTKKFGFVDPLPPFHCHKSAEFIPFVCFMGTPLPHPLRASYMEAPLAKRGLGIWMRGSSRNSTRTGFAQR